MEPVTVKLSLTLDLSDPETEQYNLALGPDQLTLGFL